MQRRQESVRLARYGAFSGGILQARCTPYSFLSCASLWHLHLEATQDGYRGVEPDREKKESYHSVRVYPRDLQKRLTRREIQPMLRRLREYADLSRE